MRSSNGTVHTACVASKCAGRSDRCAQVHCKAFAPTWKACVAEFLKMYSELLSFVEDRQDGHMRFGQVDCAAYGGVLAISRLED